MLHYRSDFLHYMKMLMMSPLFLIGSWEEKQLVSVDLFSNYMEDEVSTNSRRITFNGNILQC